MIEIDGKQWEISEQSEDKIVLKAVPEIDELRDKIKSQEAGV